MNKIIIKLKAIKDKENSFYYLSFVTILLNCIFKSSFFLLLYLLLDFIY